MREEVWDELNSRSRSGTGSSRQAAYCRAGQRRYIAQLVQREWKLGSSGAVAVASNPDSAQIAC